MPLYSVYRVYSSMSHEFMLALPTCSILAALFFIAFNYLLLGFIWKFQQSQVKWDLTFSMLSSLSNQCTVSLVGCACRKLFGILLSVHMIHNSSWSFKQKLLSCYVVSFVWFLPTCFLNTLFQIFGFLNCTINKNLAPSLDALQSRYSLRVLYWRLICLT